FIDAKSFVVSSSPKEKRLDSSALNSFIRNNEESDFRRIVSNDIIKQFEYNLSVPRYFQKEYDGITLNNVGIVFRGLRVSEGQQGKFIRIRDLKDDKLQFNLDIEKIENVEIPRYARMIDESCILLAIRWKTLKPTFFEYTGTPIYISQDIISFKINETKLDVGYCISELNSEYVLEQVDSYRSGELIPTIKQDDLLRIKIQVPSLSEQVEKKLLAQKELLNIEEQKLSQLRKDTGLDVADQNSFLRHQIAGPLRNIRSSTKNIRAILDKYLSEMIPDFNNLKLDDSASLTLGKYFEILERDLKAINKSTQKTGIDIELKELNISKVEIIQFVKDYYFELKERKNKIYDLELNILDEDIHGNDVNKAFIICDPELIRKMFDNLIDNAEKHAFQNRYSIKNRIEIDLIFDFQEMDVQIDFTNTGKPVSKGFSIDKFIRKGMKAGENGGDGIGLWYINEIIKAHGGRLNFTDETGPEGLTGDLASTFELKFPIEIENNSDDEIQSTLV
ncbi:MAG: ATP-binding protein, partial [Ignavibacteria bacterium]|nr:ATP-binding protein [Ignavibacteria bacterium]